MSQGMYDWTLNTNFVPDLNLGRREVTYERFAPETVRCRREAGSIVC